MAGKMKKIDLLSTIEAIHPDGIVRGKRRGENLIVLIELPKHWQAAEVIKECFTVWQPTEKDTWYSIDLRGIAVITPYVARALITATTQIARTLQKPVLLTNVKKFALESLDAEAWCLKSPPFWIIEESGRAQITGKISRPLLHLIEMMPNGDGRLFTNPVPRSPTASKFLQVAVLVAGHNNQKTSENAKKQSGENR